jgi:hypothetical protein
MNQIIKPGQGVLFMKVGTHANEGLADIVARKRREIQDAGFGLWGYGGNTCHPSSMVQPFAHERAEAGGSIILCMEPMISNHFAPPVRADEFSEDGLTWQPIDARVNAVGSRYALVIESLDEAEFDLPLAQTEVAVGPSMGRIGGQYIQGRVDKACLIIREEPALVNDPRHARNIPIRLTAKLRAPYAVFLRSGGGG